MLRNKQIKHTYTHMHTHTKTSYDMTREHSVIIKSDQEICIMLEVYMILSLHCLWPQLCPTIPTQRWFSSSVKYEEICSNPPFLHSKVEREDNEIQCWKLVDLLPPVYHKPALLISIWERKKRLIMYVSTLTMRSFKVVIWGCRWTPNVNYHDCLVYAFDRIFLFFHLRIFLSFQ